MPCGGREGGKTAVAPLLCGELQVYQSTLALCRHPGLGLPDAAGIPLSAATAGFFLSFVLSPAELIKARGRAPALFLFLLRAWGCSCAQGSTLGGRAHWLQ